MASPAQQPSQDLEVERIKKGLFKLAMQCKWDDVLVIYQQEPRAHSTQITKSGDTALHIAVSDRKESIVEKLVKLINDEVKRAKGASTSSQEGERNKAENFEHPLQIANQRGNTPLHMAASIGNVRMCLCIAREHRELVGIHNKEKETPLFLAALHGKKEAFLCLHDICEPIKRYACCRRADGETILHCAISGEYFDLAYQIAHKYDALINSVNEQGRSPLHLLASMPAAFKSGSHLGRFNKMIYHCIYVEKLKEESFHHHSTQQTVENKWDPEKYPKNYTTCINLFQVLDVLWNMIKITVISVTKKRDLEKGQCDAPQGQGHTEATKADSKNSGKKQHGAPQNQGEQSRDGVDEQPRRFPPNYYISIKFIKFVYRAMFVILGIFGILGLMGIKRIRDMKEKHIWSIQIMNKLLDCSSEYDSSTGSQPSRIAFREIMESVRTEMLQKKENREKDQDKTSTDETAKIETPILIAAKNGIIEMVESILELFPVAIHDMNSEKKNLVLLAVENRQQHVYGLLLKREILRESIFHVVDHEGNSALHLAAKLSNRQPWRIHGAALLMQWEIKWYEYVRYSMPRNFFPRYNNNNQTARDVFIESHKDLVEKGSKWLTSASKSCSIVATLITTVAFATSASIPGGLNEDSSRPNLENNPAFIVYAVSSLISVTFSITSMIAFLAVLTSKFDQEDFRRNLPRKMLVGLTSLFISLAAMLVCFCAGHSFLLKDELKINAYPVYALACVPVTFFAIMQFPFYFDFIAAMFKVVP